MRLEWRLPSTSERGPVGCSSVIRTPAEALRVAEGIALGCHLGEFRLSCQDGTVVHTTAALLREWASDGPDRLPRSAEFSIWRLEGERQVAALSLLTGVGSLLAQAAASGLISAAAARRAMEVVSASADRLPRGLDGAKGPLGSV